LYILTAYHLCAENLETEGDLYVFKVPKEEMKKIIASHGGYAHGTIREHGKITLESIGNMEYAIRPAINDNCWKDLLPFRISEELL
jgi:glutamyl/glutaminyl-tRNA synthetase